MYFIYMLSITILIFITIYFSNNYFKEYVILISFVIYGIPLFVLNIVQCISMSRFVRKSNYDECKKLINEFGTVDLV